MTTFTNRIYNHLIAEEYEQFTELYSLISKDISNIKDIEDISRFCIKYDLNPENLNNEFIPVFINTDEDSYRGEYINLLGLSILEGNSFMFNFLNKGNLHSIEEDIFGKQTYSEDDFKPYDIVHLLKLARTQHEFNFYSSLDNAFHIVNEHVKSFDNKKEDFLWDLFYFISNEKLTRLFDIENFLKIKEVKENRHIGSFVKSHLMDFLPLPCFSTLLNAFDINPFEEMNIIKKSYLNPDFFKDIMSSEELKNQPEHVKDGIINGVMQSYKSHSTILSILHENQMLNDIINNKTNFLDNYFNTFSTAHSFGSIAKIQNKIAEQTADIENIFKLLKENYNYTYYGSALDSEQNKSYMLLPKNDPVNPMIKYLIHNNLKDMSKENTEHFVDEFTKNGYIDHLYTILDAKEKNITNTAIFSLFINNFGNDNRTRFFKEDKGYETLSYFLSTDFFEKYHISLSKDKLENMLLPKTKMEGLTGIITTRYLLELNLKETEPTLTTKKRL